MMHTVIFAPLQDKSMNSPKIKIFHIIIKYSHTSIAQTHLEPYGKPFYYLLCKTDILIIILDILYKI